MLIDFSVYLVHACIILPRLQLMRQSSKDYPISSLIFSWLTKTPVYTSIAT